MDHPEQFVPSLKPDLAKAERYLAEGCYYWNSGMFVFQTEVFLKELQEQSAEVVIAASTPGSTLTCTI